jgi:hypothetical protein
MSPGDESYREPYFYVSPWPYPSERSGPALAGGGHWHTEGFFAAVLPGTELIRAGDDQAAALVAFVRSAVAASRTLAGR